MVSLAVLVVLTVPAAVGLCFVLYRKGEKQRTEAGTTGPGHRGRARRAQENEDDATNVPSVASVASVASAVAPLAPSIQFNVNAQFVQVGNCNRCSVDGHEPGSPVT
ncbi:unnamed protein product [Lampetra planeri]